MKHINLLNFENISESPSNEFLDFSFLVANLFSEQSATAEISTEDFATSSNPEFLSSFSIPIEASATSNQNQIIRRLSTFSNLIENTVWLAKQILEAVIQRLRPLPKVNLDNSVSSWVTGSRYLN